MANEFLFPTNAIEKARATRKRCQQNKVGAKRKGKELIQIEKQTQGNPTGQIEENRIDLTQREREIYLQTIN